ncbi:DUF484 family protein [Vibrio sp. FNV 38]|nr:DUF484 family protein [Vibrio sp. FNV 38]
MSQVEANALTAEVVTEYLRDHPDFFLSRPDLVERLALPHQDQGAVSLVHVQLQRQRQKIEELEEEITALMSLARQNDQTFHDFMGLQERVLKSRSITDAIQAVEQLAVDLNLVAYIKLVESEASKCQLASDVFKRFVTNHLNGKTAYLGRLRQADRHALFVDGDNAPEMGSYVVLPLGFQQPFGLLAFSSQDGGHFQPQMDTLFLRHLALVLTHVINTQPWQAVIEDERICNTSA